MVKTYFKKQETEVQKLQKILNWERRRKKYFSRELQKAIQKNKLMSIQKTFARTKKKKKKEEIKICAPKNLFIFKKIKKLPKKIKKSKKNRIEAKFKRLEDEEKMPNYMFDKIELYKEIKRRENELTVKKKDFKKNLELNYQIWVLKMIESYGILSSWQKKMKEVLETDRISYYLNEMEGFRFLNIHGCKMGPFEKEKVRTAVSKSVKYNTFSVKKATSLDLNVLAMYKRNEWMQDVGMEISHLCHDWGCGAHTIYEDVVINRRLRTECKRKGKCECKQEKKMYFRKKRTLERREKRKKK